MDSTLWQRQDTISTRDLWKKRRAVEKPGGKDLANGLQKLDADEVNIACLLLPFYACLDRRHAGGN
jgi:hypothetical protein